MKPTVGSQSAIFSTAMVLNQTINEAFWEHREELRLLSVGIQSVFKEKLMFSSARKGWGTYVGQICEEASPANDSRRKVSQGHLFTLRDASHFIGPWLLFILVDLSSGLHG